MNVNSLPELIFALACILLFLYFYFLALRGSGSQGKAFMAVTSIISFLYFTRAIGMWGLVAFYLLFLYVIAIGIMGEFFGANNQD
jgi:hypothetical protein